MFKQEFIHWYFEEFQQDPLYQAMAETVEGSPWHRERNVGVHTDMVVTEYLNRNASHNDILDVRGAIGCAFHDVGKPPAEVIKFREDRGEYKAFHGHELVSARLWEDWAVRNWQLLREKFSLSPEDIYAIGWMIEHHVPWATKKDEKLNAFGATAFETIGGSNAWIDMLLSDQYGRISDESHQRGEEAAEWVRDHRIRVSKAEYRWKKHTDKAVYMLIGAPGSGKSTFRNKQFQDTDHTVVSMDDLRMEWYDKNDYETAFAKASKDSSFNAKVDKFYIETLRENDMVVLDNTNTAAKARKRWIAPAKARDFKVIGVLFPVALQTILDRQKTREDKTIPDHVVRNMYERMSLPMYGEFDDVIVYDGNLPA